MDAHGWLFGGIVTKGIWPDCKEASKLSQDIVAESVVSGWSV